MKVIYLEVDNVIVRNGKPAPHIRPFLEYITRRFDVYFLTKITQEDDASKVLEHIDQKINEKDLLPLLENIPVQTWTDVRSDGIDMSKKHIWYNNFDFDEAEEKYIEENNLSFGRSVSDDENFFLHEIEIYEKLRIDSLSPAYYFIQNKGTNLRGESYDDVLDYDNEKLEQDHQYIQWIFPTHKPSEAVEGAPYLSNEEVLELRGNTIVVTNLSNAVIRMQKFYTHSTPWLREYDHNHLRITRIITSLKILVGKNEAHDFYTFIMNMVQKNGATINEESLNYWKKAVSH